MEEDERRELCELRRQATWLAPLTSGVAHKSASPQDKIHHWLQHVYVHRLLMALLALDMAFVLSQGVLDSQYSESLISDYEAYVKACPPHAAHLRRLALGGGAEGARGNIGGVAITGRLSQRSDPTLPDADRATLAAVLKTKRRLGGDDHVDCANPHFGNHALHDAEQAVRPMSFCRHPMFVADMVVVVLSLALEVLSAVQVLRHAAWGGLLIMVRVWRFARIGHGVFVAESRRKDSKDSQSGGHASAKDRPGATKVVPVQNEEIQPTSLDEEES